MRSGDEEQGEQPHVNEKDNERLPRYLDTLGDPPLDGLWPYAPEGPPHAKVSEGDQHMDGAQPLDSLGLLFMTYINNGSCWFGIGYSTFMLLHSKG